ncbi:MAG: box helicase domain protein, partial [Pedosphaera sp.]|nr:box helicase domain protein [Pedosphaera sp.]
KVERIKLENFNYKYTALFEEGKPGQPTGYARKVKGVRLSGGYYFGPAKKRR